MNPHLNNLPKPSENVVLATKGGRIFCIGMILLCAGLIALFFLYALPTIRTSLIQTPTAQAVIIIKATLIIFTALGVVFGGLTIRQGIQILRLGQYPLPNAWVWRDTKVIRGPRINGIGVFSILLGVVTCIVSLGLTTIVLINFPNLTTDTPLYKTRTDIKILQEKKYTSP